MELILKHVEPNDFVVSMRSFQGGIEWWGERGCISSAYVMLIPSCKVDPVFSCYLFKSSRYDGQAMRFDNFTQLDLPVVPEGEQARIADFLMSRLRRSMHSGRSSGGSTLRLWDIWRVQAISAERRQIRSPQSL